MTSVFPNENDPNVRLQIQDWFNQNRRFKKLVLKYIRTKLYESLKHDKAEEGLKML